MVEYDWIWHIDDWMGRVQATRETWDEVVGEGMRFHSREDREHMVDCLAFMKTSANLYLLVKSCFSAWKKETRVNKARRNKQLRTARRQGRLVALKYYFGLWRRPTALQAEDFTLQQMVAERVLLNLRTIMIRQNWKLDEVPDVFEYKNIKVLTGILIRRTHLINEPNAVIWNFVVKSLIEHLRRFGDRPCIKNKKFILDEHLCRFFVEKYGVYPFMLQFKPSAVESHLARKSNYKEGLFEISGIPNKTLHISYGTRH